MKDYGRLMEEHRRINARWTGALGRLNEVARGEIKPGICKGMP